jgi:hypothetical protein
MIIVYVHMSSLAKRFGCSPYAVFLFFGSGEFEKAIRTKYHYVETSGPFDSNDIGFPKRHPAPNLLRQRFDTVAQDFDELFRKIKPNNFVTRLSKWNE